MRRMYTKAQLRSIAERYAKSVIDDDSISVDKTWSSDKINDELEATSHTHSNKSILDGITSTNLVSSSDRTNWNGKTSINDSSTTSTTETWSCNKLNSILGNIEAALRAIRGVL